MNFWNQDSTSQRLIKSARQFRKLDWNKETIGKFKPSEIEVLFCIRKLGEEQDVTVSDISKFLRVTSPTVTQIINRLDESGLVERQINKEDRRSIKVTLTDEGDVITEQAAEKYAASINGLIEFLGDDQSEQLIKLMDKVFLYYNDKKKI
ncbi:MULTISPECIES: MarR family winged helix-turn-helix transcriptional regulator [Paraliobacillus]|uniref:MarR family winged helix-turn-helix transcriptional regulator n=1 Tax=Paraliobacillus TaxID=200903 RepID=UPI000DD4A6D1|nr:MULTISPECIES: MarR family transcriptional regulator [Paraliobacillus]